MDVFDSMGVRGTWFTCPLDLLYISTLFLLFYCCDVSIRRTGSCETTAQEKINLTKKKNRQSFQSQINRERKAGSRILKWSCVEFGQDVSRRDHNGHCQGQDRNEKIRCQSVWRGKDFNLSLSVYLTLKKRSQEPNNNWRAWGNFLMFVRYKSGSDGQVHCWWSTDYLPQFPNFWEDYQSF